MKTPADMPIEVVDEPIVTPERVSLELLTRCSKACSFCYNGSDPRREERWEPEEVIALGKSLAEHGTRAVSLGGGEPLEYEGLEEVFAGLRETSLFVSMTTNGLLLDEQMTRVSRLNPDKVHVSVHFPKREREVERVIRQVTTLTRMGIRSGINLLVRDSELDVVTAVAKQIREAGINNRRIMYLPMRGEDTPSPEALAEVAGKQPFQTMTCVLECGRSPRFCSIDASKTVAHCSYTLTRRPLATLDAKGLSDALFGLGLKFCGEGQLTKLRVL